MTPVEIEIVNDGNIEQCRDLCNELMAFQKSLAVISPETFDGMNFETRLKASYENSPVNQLIVAKDNGVAVGYVFSTIESVNSGDKSSILSWAPVNNVKEAKGFYPDWDNLPNNVGCLNHLYIRKAYQGMGIGSKFLEMALQWIEHFSDIHITFVYISNGNDAALNFYLKNGFLWSHDVFNGFIKAVYKWKDKHTL